MTSQIPKCFENRILEEVFQFGNPSMVDGALVIRNKTACLLINLIEQCSLEELIKEHGRIISRVFHHVPRIYELLEKKELRHTLDAEEESALLLAEQIGVQEIGILNHCIQKAAHTWKCTEQVQALIKKAIDEGKISVAKEANILTIRELVRQKLAAAGGSPVRTLLSFENLLNGEIE